MKKNIDYNNAFWKMRSQHYNDLEWANNRLYLEAFVRAGKFKRSDVVLDVGTGTGIVAHAISPLVEQVIGLDKSQDMLEHSNWHGNMYFIKKNILNSIFKDNVFNKITCRQVFHHILKFRQSAMDECWRMLKDEGMMIFSEGVPPTKRVKKDYIKIFKLKEQRVTFYEEDLVKLMEKSNFRDIKIKIVHLRKMSIKNWLKSSGLAKEIQEKIFRLHKYAHSYFKEDYNMIETSHDCLIDMKMAILSGRKRTGRRMREQ